MVLFSPVWSWHCLGETRWRFKPWKTSEELDCFSFRHEYLRLYSRIELAASVHVMSWKCLFHHCSTGYWMIRRFLLPQVLKKPSFFLTISVYIESQRLKIQTNAKHTMQCFSTLHSVTPGHANEIYWYETHFKFIRICFGRIVYLWWKMSCTDGLNVTLINS